MPTGKTVAEAMLKRQYGAENSPAGRNGGLEQAGDAASGPAYSEGPTPGAADLSGLVQGHDSQARKE